jgi:hypothetical protein
MDRLIQPFGAASPMGLLWTFMGSSRAYSVLAGAGEVGAGVLLTMRRTTLAGALLAMIVIGNVVALNFCYDVPVKLYASLLFLMAASLALPDAKRLIGLLFQRREPPLFRRPAVDRVVRALRTAAVVAFFAVSLRNAMHARQGREAAGTRSPLRGLWNVDELTENGVARPPLTTDGARWRRLTLDYTAFGSIYLMNDQRLRYGIAIDEKKQTISFAKRDDPKTTFTLAYAHPRPDVLTLDGLSGGRTIHAVCHRSAAPSSLMTRGFHWISEAPFNR